MPETSPVMSRPTHELSPTEEASLVEDLRQACPAAFERLVRGSAPRVLATCRRILGSESDAQDAVQDTFLSAFRSIGSFQGSSRLATWLHRIAVNAALMRLRSQRRRPERSIEELLPTYHLDGHRVDPRDAWSVEDESALEREERSELVHRALDQLPDDYRTVIVLRDLESLDTDEVATLLGITAGAVKTRLHRARQALRTLLEREFLP